MRINFLQFPFAEHVQPGFYKYVSWTGHHVFQLATIFRWPVHIIQLKCYICAMNKTSWFGLVYPKKHVHLLCFFVVLSSYQDSFCSIYPHTSGSLNWHWGNRMIIPLPVNWTSRTWVKLGSTQQQQKATNVLNYTSHFNKVERRLNWFHLVRPSIHL